MQPTATDSEANWSALAQFHPAVADWFRAALGEPTAAQSAAWQAIAAGRHTLVAAPTGSGKTLAAFLAAIDALVQEGLGRPLPDAVRVLYISPLKALSNDIALNLERPLAGIADALLEQGLPGSPIRTQVRTGDTPQVERERMRRQPPHILVTTPESLYILLTSASGRTMLAGVRTVIVDEIHAVAQTKRGAHLTLSLARLDALTGRPVQRIGLSATQRPIEDVARLLVGAHNVADDGTPDCIIVDHGHRRTLDIDLLLPPAPLETLMATEVWETLYDRLCEQIEAHRATVLFVNTRRMAERVAHALSGRLGADRVTAHHGSLSREHRLNAEQRLKSGALKCIVATASLELGIDIGHVDFVIQLGSPRLINAFLQRVGRSGHWIGGLPTGRLVPTTRDELIECTALLAAVRAGDLDELVIPNGALDVLAQQIVAEVAACGELAEHEVYERLRVAWPYRNLARTDFDAVVLMLARGFATERGVRGAWLHRDAVQQVLRPRRGARLAAMTSGGTIPDQADIDVILEPEGLFVGTVNEDFAIESLTGDIFQLGNQSYRVLGSESGRLRVEDAGGLPPSMPFWFGEAPGRSHALSRHLSELRAGVAARLAEGEAAVRAWVVEHYRLTPEAAAQIVDHLAAAHAALGALPTLHHVIFERFFDESGGMQLVIHSPFGARINRGWGLALRKRFCRQFNFELQAAADDDTIVLSLSTRHSFPLAEVAHYLNAASVRDTLTQAVLTAPLYINRWRWVATTALAILRMRNGRKTPPQLQRMQAEDLIAQVFPDQIACQENIAGPRTVPDHPLVNQSLVDALSDAMDIDGLERLIADLHAGRIQLTACDLAAPSPLAAAILNARPYTFLDDAPAEERRTRAVTTPRLTSADAARLAQPDPDAVATISAQAWPEARNADEVQDALVSLAFVTEEEGIRSGWRTWFVELCAQRRACSLHPPAGTLWIAAEWLPAFRPLFADPRPEPAIEPPADAPVPADRETALVEILRARIGALGPVTAAELVAPLGLAADAAATALIALEVEGGVLRGRFRAGADTDEWCERRLLQRIHRASVGQRRSRFRPVAPARFLRFLLEWQRVAPGSQGRGPQALAAVVEQLEGFETAAGAWESDVLPARIVDYDSTWLDQLCLAGRLRWARLTPPASGGAGSGPIRATPIALLSRRRFAAWRSIAAGGPVAAPGARTRRVLDALAQSGALFFDELGEATGLLRAELEDALGELVTLGCITADSFQALRALTLPADRKRGRRWRALRPALLGLEDAGRWSALPTAAAAPEPSDLEAIAWVYLRRWGVVSRRLLERESLTPSWRTLREVYRRLEDRGQIHGGRFVQGLAGEQFALPDAATALAGTERAGHTKLVISGCDPLNLTGLIGTDERVPARSGNRILLRDGLPVAARIDGEVRALGTTEVITPETEALLRRRQPLRETI